MILLSWEIAKHLGRADVKIVLLTARTLPIQYGDQADGGLCLWNLGIIKGTRKNDTIDSTENASLHHPDKEKYKKKAQTSKNEDNGEEEKSNHRDSDDDAAEGSSTNTDCDQDSDVFMKDSDEEIDTVQIEEEEWIEFMNRSTAIAIKRMIAAKIPCWMETFRKMKWRLAMRIASLPDERWTEKAAKWNPGLSTK